MRNIRTGVKVLVTHRSEIAEHLPMIDLAALEKIERLALATQYSAMEASKSTPSERLVSERLSEGRRLRGTLLPIVAGLAATGHIPQSEYDDVVPPAEKAPPRPAAVDVRNRFATLLTRRHEELQVVGFYFERWRVEQVVPPLMSRQASRTKRIAPTGEP